MDYSNDSCMTTFTPIQRAVMVASWCTYRFPCTDVAKDPPADVPVTPLPTPSPIAPTALPIAPPSLAPAMTMMMGVAAVATATISGPLNTVPTAGPLDAVPTLAPLDAIPIGMMMHPTGLPPP
jgi:hypothetical protein